MKKPNHTMISKKQPPASGGVAKTKYYRYRNQSLCARILYAMKKLAISSASIYLAVALSRFIAVSIAKAYNLVGILFSLLAVSAGVSRLNCILSMYSKTPNKIWILSSACGHAIAFLYRDLVINLAEILKIVERGYAAVAFVLHIYFCMCYVCVVQA